METIYWKRIYFILWVIAYSGLIVLSVFQTGNGLSDIVHKVGAALFLICSVGAYGAYSIDVTIKTNGLK